MAIKYSEEQRERIIESIKGKTVEDIEFCKGDDIEPMDYWAITFAGGEEFCFRFMSELM